jgi:uncharacterized protein YbjQ (UPF0145 family)
MSQRGPQILDLHASLELVKKGGIPLRARERLSEEARPDHPIFTTDLSVPEYLLAKDVGAEPISQVMGSSIYHIAQIPDYKGKTGEMTILSDAHREARRRALGRIAQEAAFVRADAVVGARLRERMITMGSHGKGGDDGGEVIEFTVVGTAVRAPWITHPPDQPIVTDLSGQELWALAQDGYEPCGFLFEFCRYHVWHVTSDSQRSGELFAANDAVEQARNIAAAKIHRQAQFFGSELVVGSDIQLSVREVPCGFGGCELNDLDVDVSWFCTGIRRIPNVARRAHVEVPPLILAMTPVGRRKDARILAGDDTNEVERAARDAEEAAAEADEGGGL